MGHPCQTRESVEAKTSVALAPPGLELGEGGANKPTSEIHGRGLNTQGFKSGKEEIISNK